MTVPPLDLTAQHEPILDELRTAFEDVLASGRFVLGPHVQAFEQQLADYCEAKGAVGVSSGTDALLVALMAIDLKPGDEVITTPFTFFATAGCIARTGATPVFVDIDPVTFNLDPAKIEPAITDRTRAIVPVHLFGQACDMDPVMAIANKHDLKVIEDAAQAIGARDRGRPVGPIGDIGCFSFYPTKNLPALGDGGAVVTNDEAMLDKLRILRDHGQNPRYHYQMIGGNFRLDEMQAAFLEVKLPHLDGWAAARREHACRYHRLLEDTPLTLPDAGEDKFHVYNQYTVRCADKRDDLLAHLREAGVIASIYYPMPLHVQPCFEALGGKAGDLPISEAASNEVLSLPLFPEMTDAQQDEVSAAVHGFFEGGG